MYMASTQHICYSRCPLASTHQPISRFFIPSANSSVTFPTDSSADDAADKDKGTPLGKDDKKDDKDDSNDQGAKKKDTSRVPVTPVAPIIATGA